MVSRNKFSVYFRRPNYLLATFQQIILKYVDLVKYTTFDLYLLFPFSTVYCLQCYHCDNSLNNACNLSKLVQCPEDMDVCSLEATWFGKMPFIFLSCSFVEPHSNHKITLIT